MSCNHEDSEKTAQIIDGWFSQALDWELVLHVESRTGAERRRRASRPTHVVLPMA